MGIVDEVIENAVHEAIERFFEDGKVPSGLAKSINKLIETAVENAVEKMATAQASSFSLPASSGVTTSREQPRTSSPTWRDDEGNQDCEDCEFHDVIIIKDKNNKFGVFHSARCHHIDGGLTSSLVKCNHCTNQRLKYWSSR